MQTFCFKRVVSNALQGIPAASHSIDTVDLTGSKDCAFVEPVKPRGSGVDDEFFTTPGPLADENPHAGPGFKTHVHRECALGSESIGVTDLITLAPTMTVLRNDKQTLELRMAAKNSH